MSEGQSRLAALVDGAPLGEAEARALWTAFSAHMDEHRGDMAGFAKARGYFEVRPEFRGGQAVLVVSTTEEAAKKAAPPPPKPKPAAKGPAKKAAPKAKPAARGPAKKAAPPPGGKAKPGPKRG